MRIGEHEPRAFFAGNADQVAEAQDLFIRRLGMEIIYEMSNLVADGKRFKHLNLNTRLCEFRLWSRHRRQFCGFGNIFIVDV